MDKYVTYPPRGPLPLPGTSVEFDDGCDVFDMIASAAMIVNPAFNPYRIFDMVSGALHDPAMRLMGHFFFTVADPLGCTGLPVNITLPSFFF